MFNSDTNSENPNVPWSKVAVLLGINETSHLKNRESLQWGPIIPYWVDEFIPEKYMKIMGVDRPDRTNDLSFSLEPWSSFAGIDLQKYTVLILGS